MSVLQKMKSTVRENVCGYSFPMKPSVPAAKRSKAQKNMVKGGVSNKVVKSNGTAARADMEKIIAVAKSDIPNSFQVTDKRNSESSLPPKERQV